MNPTAQTETAPDPFARTELPIVMLAADVAAALGLKSASAARRAILRGECGPYSRRGRRMMVRREAFLEALRARETVPAIAPGAGFEGSAPRWATSLGEALGRSRNRR